MQGLENTVSIGVLLEQKSSKDVGGMVTKHRTSNEVWEKSKSLRGFCRPKNSH